MATNFSQFFFLWKCTGIASCVLKFQGKKPKIVDFFLMANFLWSFFSEPKIHSQNWTSGCHFEKKEVNLRMPLLNLRMPLSWCRYSRYSLLRELMINFSISPSFRKLVLNPLYLDGCCITHATMQHYSRTDYKWLLHHCLLSSTMASRTTIALKLHQATCSYFVP